MRPRSTQAALVALSVAIAGCATTPAGPPAGVGPQALRLATYRWAGLTGTDPGPGRGWGAPGSSAPEPLPGAHCTASNDRGSWTLATPGTVQVVRSAASLRITCRRDGFREASVELRCITPRAAAAAAKGSAFQFAIWTIPGAVIVLPAAVIVAGIAGAGAAGGAADTAAQAVQEPDVCAYGAGGDVQVWMEAGR